MDGSCSSMQLRLDCRHYRGDRPCEKNCQNGCEHYEPMGHRILVIKLGALGDVIRTEVLLPGLKAKYPSSHITWVTKANGCQMLANNPFIDRLLEFNSETLCHLCYEAFDLVVSLDKEPAPAALAMRVHAPDKRGVGLSRLGTACPLNPEAHYYFALGLNNRLKFNENLSSYQKLIYESVGLRYEGQRYTLYPSEANHQYARRVFRQAGVEDDQSVVGLNTGAGSVFANKTWPKEKFAVLARRLLARGDCRVALLGGPEEVEVNAWLAKALGPNVIDTGCRHAELDFAAIVHRCRVFLTGDTMAMHVGIALRVPAVVLFGPTCHQEIDVYERGVKLISSIECSPCYRRHCDYSPSCMDLIGIDEAAQALERFLDGEATPYRDTEPAVVSS